MGKLIISIFGTICILSLILYDFVCVCKFLGKEQWVEYLWNQLVPNVEFNEKFFFVFGKSMLLYTSMMCYMISVAVLERMMFFRILLPLTPIFACLAVIKNLKK